MNSNKFIFQAQRSAVAVAVGLACITVQAQSDTVQATVSVGLAGVDGANADLAQFGQYNTARVKGANPGVAIDYSLRDPEAGKWVELSVSNLLDDTRDLGLVWKNPGLWKFTANYSDLVHNDPNTITTSLVNAGTTQPLIQANGAAVNALDLSTKRSNLSLGLTRIFSPNLQVQASATSENKDGARLSGALLNCVVSVSPACINLGGGSLAVALLPEPVKSNHTQLEARVSYALEKLRLSVGYYGSFYRNDNNYLNPTGNPLTSSSSALIALPPDNEAHQFDLTGSYDLTPTTRGTVKLAYATALQRDDFSALSLAGNLDAKVVTTTAKLGLNSRPIPKLTLQADLRYEDKDDQTSLYAYNLVGTNRQLPNTKVQGKLQALWQFSADYRGTVGADVESIDRGTFTASSLLQGVSALRQKTDETTVRAELRRRMASDLSGALTVSSSSRTGGSWSMANTIGTGVTQLADPAATLGASAVYLPTQMDRKRDKIRLSTNWQPTEKLSLQFNAEGGSDTFTAPIANGLRDTRMSQLGLDASYVISSDWVANGYVAQSKQTLNQAVYTGTVLAFDNTNLALSLGVTGKVSERVQVGASLSYQDDKSAYSQSVGSLPDVTFRQDALKLFATYGLDNKSTVRLDVLHQQNRLSDWTWGANGVPFVYADGSTVSQSPDQKVNYVGVTYTHVLH